MGNASTRFTRSELEEYQELTYLSQKEILHCWDRFAELDQDEREKVSMDEIRSLPELKENPFSDRICAVFSTTEDGSLTFEDFLDMMSVFSENAPRDVKIEYAFLVYDFDGDKFINATDMREVIDRLCGEQKLDRPHVDKIVEKIMEEGDFDEDDKLNFAEFKNVIEKAPDFTNTFRFRRM